MASKRRYFRRKDSERSYRKVFILAVEGIKTEPEYFNIFNDRNSVIHVNCLKKKKGRSPSHILSQMEHHLKNADFKPSDEAWLVVDKDQWTEKQLLNLHQWSQKSENYGFALSNPKFEFWLLLHFEDGKDISSSRKCSQKLRHYLPSYDKSVDAKKITNEMVDNAIRRAKLRDNPPCENWPHTTGTTVYKLVEKILESKSKL